MITLGTIAKPKPKAPLLPCQLKGNAAKKVTKEANAAFVKGKELASRKQYDREGCREGRAVYVRCPKAKQVAKKAQPAEMRIGANKQK